MNTKTLGCLTPVALISAAISIIILLIVSITGGNEMFSPGALYHEHNETSGDCASCHAPFWGKERMADRCLQCHTEIQTQLSDPTSLHGGALKVSAAPCTACHTDHKGTDAKLTNFNFAIFPHTVFGFSLDKHSGNRLNGMGGKAIECSDCHASSYAEFSQTTCLQCHSNLNVEFSSKHVSDFSENCLSCHDGLDRFSQFDHSATPFPVTGAHNELACSTCHQNSASLAALQNADRSCANCHKQDDNHDGKFGYQCEFCHSSLAWEPANFDHDRGIFPLEGKHADAECETCHAQQYAGTPTECVACHQKDDEHNGSFGVNCQGCHNPTDWEDAEFDHSTSAFPLTGAHTNTDCESCHINNVFAGTSAECAACHTDPEYHRGMFPNQPCSLCHSANAWSPAQYNLAHSFPMNHGEERGANTCASCHQLTLAQWTCYTCHSQASVESKHREEGISNFTNCLECHPTGQEGEGGD